MLAMLLSAAYVRRLAMLSVLIPLVGCGLRSPSISEIWDRDFTYSGEGLPPGVREIVITGTGQVEYELRKKIFCELKEAVIETQKLKVSDDGARETKLIPSDWVAHVAVSFTVDEASSLNPGIALKTPVHSAVTHFPGEVSGSALQTGAGYGFLTTPQTYSLGVGGTASSTATRIDRYDPYYTIANLETIPKNQHVCDYLKNGRVGNEDYFFKVSNGEFKPARSSPLIVSDLKLKEWLTDSMFFSRKLPSHIEVPKPPPTPASLQKEREKLARQGFSAAEITQIIAGKGSGSSGGVSGVGSATKPDTISIELKFIVVTSGNVTPTWNLLRVSANTGATPLFSTGRTRTHDLLITIGPPNNDTSNSHLASLIGQAISNQARSPGLP